MKDCNSCGKCCIKYSNGGLSATQQDLDGWEDARPEIFAYVEDEQIWADPSSGKQLELCPFLTIQSNPKSIGENPKYKKITYSCDIYFDRPEDCRIYPSTVEEMIRDDCEMIEPKDIKSPKQAERDLHIIMSDSWR